jgi:hypothetical protein
VLPGVVSLRGSGVPNGRGLGRGADQAGTTFRIVETRAECYPNLSESHKMTFENLFLIPSPPPPVIERVPLYQNGIVPQASGCTLSASIKANIKWGYELTEFELTARGTGRRAESGLSVSLPRVLLDDAPP